jgi:shikimate 5-dehydrogenase
LVYNPKETLFLTNGKEHGATVQNGYKMLCYQAEEAWRVWKNCKLFFSTETQSSQSITEENLSSASSQYNNNKKPTFS